nr:MAG TPA_asm: hypothetical protein [Caudoviricetes sp.]DAX12474.1 MAG TPA: hypothetical protein [Caudoviricetes sp.]
MQPILYKRIGFSFALFRLCISGINCFIKSSKIIIWTKNAFYLS